MNNSNRPLYDHDIDPAPLLTRTVAIIGYGAQGRSHALNLRDSGIQVVVGQREGGNGFRRAEDDGFLPLSIADATGRADLVCLMVPDELHGRLFDSGIREEMQPGAMLLVCHGFSLLYQQVIPPEGCPSILVAPKGAGHMVRTAYEQGGGVACLVGLGPHATESEHLPVALAYARALGGGRAGVLQTTLGEETETDLFGEQAVLCGGVSHLAAAAFEILVEAGYREEIAYFECVHELQLVVDLLHRGGLAFMRDHISNTAEYGDYTRGPRIVDDHVRQRMREILQEIQSGQFAREWIEEADSGGHRFSRLRQLHRERPIEGAAQGVLQMLRGEDPD